VYVVSGGKAPLILSLGSRCECSASRPDCFSPLFELNMILLVPVPVVARSKAQV